MMMMMIKYGARLCTDPSEDFQRSMRLHLWLTKTPRKEEREGASRKGSGRNVMQCKVKWTILKRNRKGAFTVIK